MKKLLVSLVFLMAFISSAMAMSLSLPEQVPSNTNWSFSVALDSTDSFDLVEVLIDGQKVVTAYSNGQIVIDPLNGEFVLKSFTYDKMPESTQGMVLVLSHLGLSSGQHRIVVTSFKSGAQANLVEGTISVFDALDKSYKTSTDNELEKLKGLNSELEKKLAEITEKSNKLDSLVKEKEKDIAELNSALESLTSAITGLEAHLEEKEIYDIETRERVDSLKSQVESVQSTVTEIEAAKAKEKKDQGSTMFASLGSFAFNGLIVLIVVAFVVGLYYYAKSGKEDDSSPLFRPDRESAYASSEENSEPETSLQDMAEEQEAEKSIDEKIEEEEDDWKGKWAFDANKKPTKPEKKRFSLGDLLGG